MGKLSKEMYILVINSILTMEQQLDKPLSLISLCYLGENVKIAKKKKIGGKKLLTNLNYQI